MAINKDRRGYTPRSAPPRVWNKYSYIVLIISASDSDLTPPYPQDPLANGHTPHTINFFPKFQVLTSLFFCGIILSMSIKLVVAEVEKKEEILPIVIPVLKEDETNLGNARLENKIKALYPEDPEFIISLRRLAFNLASIGLEFEEACKVVRLDPTELRKKIKMHPILQELIEIKELEYKTNLIRTISEKAIGGRDDKLAQWLLERRFPGEFNPKKGSGSSSSSDEDLLAMALEFVQKSTDSSSVVKETAGRAFIVKKNGNDNIFTDVKQILQ